MSLLETRQKNKRLASYHETSHCSIRLVALCFALLITTGVSAQLKLKTVTETEFRHPESAVYDAKRNCIYISNLEKDTPMDSLHTDFISRMDTSGTVTHVRYIENLSSPTGLAMYRDRLYAVERDGVAVIDPKDQKIRRHYLMEDVGFLNDIAIDQRNGTIYVSETDAAGRIFRIENGIVETWMQDTLLAYTNGLLVRGNTLLAGVNGDHYLKSIDLKTREIRNLAYLGPGNIDGIQKTTDGFLVSHFLGNLYETNAKGQVNEILNTRDQDIFVADFAYVSEMQLLVVPSLRTHKVYLYQYDPQQSGKDTVKTATLPRRATTPSWADSIDNYARHAFLPAKKFRWSWQHAALLRAMSTQYEQQIGPDPTVYLDYVRTAMDKTMGRDHAGQNPNGIASGFGLAWLARVTGEAKYRDAAEELYQKYQEIPRAANGGVTHLKRFRELWDDTVFMVGIYLLEMYLLTEDEQYLDELLLQVEAHREKLLVEKWGLWVHGWDGDDQKHCRMCSQSDWSNNADNRSTEIWGRGNGWVVVTLTQILESIPKTHPQWPTFAGYLEEMLQHLPELQDTSTGHWFQLPVYPHEEGNYIESSCTAMFGYGIAGALRLGIVKGEAYQRSVDRAYAGLRKHSIQSKGPYLTTQNICTGTCIGDKEYYFKRKAKGEKPFGIGMFILFGRAY